MNLKDKCKELGITLTEGKAKYNLTHWKQEVPDDTPDVVITVPAPKSKASLKEARALQDGHGDKTKAYLVYVNDNKDSLKAEYERVKHNIERYVCND